MSTRAQSTGAFDKMTEYLTPYIPDGTETHDVPPSAERAVKESTPRPESAASGSRPLRSARRKRRAAARLSTCRLTSAAGT